MDPFIGEIRMFAGTYAPEKWALCWGQLLSIAQNTALYSLLGNRYGGDGRTTFGVPDLRGRVPLGTGQGPGLTPRNLAQFSGWEKVQLDISEMPPHAHDIINTANATNNLSVSGSGSIKCSGSSGNSQDPTNAFPAKTKAVSGDKIYTTDASQATDSMNTGVIELNTNIQGSVDVNVISDCHSTGGGLYHENMQPWLCLNFIIALDGIYPSRP